MGDFELKKLIISSALLVGLSLGFMGTNVEAGVETYITSNVNAETYETKQVTVATNYGGPATFYFNPGNGAPTRSGNGEYSRKFSQYWTTNSISYYYYSGRVITQNYGPGPTVYGKATITY